MTTDRTEPLRMWKKAGASLGMVIVGIAAAGVYARNKKQGRPITGATNPAVPERDTTVYEDER